MSVGPPAAVATIKRTGRVGYVCPKATREIDGSAQNDPDRTSPNDQWCNAKDSFSLDVRGLDDGPPFLNVGLLQCAECFWGELVSRENFLPGIGEPRTHRWLGERLHRSGIECGDDTLRCAFGHPQPKPVADVKPAQSRLVDRWNVGRCGQAVFGCHRIGFDATST